MMESKILSDDTSLQINLKDEKPSYPVVK